MDKDRGVVGKGRKEVENGGGEMQVGEGGDVERQQRYEEGQDYSGEGQRRSIEGMGVVGKGRQMVV